MVSTTRYDSEVERIGNALDWWCKTNRVSGLFSQSLRFSDWRAISMQSYLLYSVIIEFRLPKCDSFLEPYNWVSLLLSVVPVGMQGVLLLPDISSFFDLSYHTCAGGLRVRICAPQSALVWECSFLSARRRTRFHRSCISLFSPHI